MLRCWQNPGWVTTTPGRKKALDTVKVFALRKYTEMLVFTQTQRLPLLGALSFCRLHGGQRQQYSGSVTPTVPAISFNFSPPLAPGRLWEYNVFNLYLDTCLILHPPLPQKCATPASTSASIEVYVRNPLSQI